ncbi:5-formyltetrahydrofolate cyclo-ligase [Glaciimonas immobilis]|uniref:5-formyltetrahydrofolate cyclo-ligase n=1 Tax=Glaciimonas immobilis TaxID=728004 RepID=A0A840RYS5_9BURK|nr:5-formyltetrahydrofolate cyclo-ligase [Glaciimonas immobilis]KAF3997314.1 5-formyltetrahydrofolate cyclo-ligase [Glaciimonas immobilis]MBB5202382.1 5,10-methenyltetrahydrofolate synthetase [Glaciimonas immobilis]
MTNQSIACDAPDSTPQDRSDKGLVRSQLLTLRQRIPIEDRKRFDATLGDNITKWATILLETNVDLVLGVYWPIRDEPDVRAAYAELVARGVRLALPVVVAKDAALQFVLWTPGDVMIKDSFGVGIPAHGEAVSPHALLIPCVGFNPQRIRMGYGGGFYDRTLATTPRPATVGVAYSCGLAQFEGAVHDIALDRIFTETGTL